MYPRLKKVAFVGPVPPFRSGISEHGGCLAAAIAREVDELRVISFSQMYPSALFPGDCEKDPDRAPLDDPKPEFVLSGFNPLTWKTAGAVLRAFRPEITVIPWWTFFLGPCSTSVARAAKKVGSEVRFLCHNVVDHETTEWKQWLSRMTLKHGDGFIVHNAALGKQVVDMLPGARVVVCPHPVNSGFARPQETLPRRAALELLYFGIVRPYKGIDILIRAVAKMPEDASVHLTIAGEFWEPVAKTETLIRALGADHRIELIARYLPETEAAALFCRADVVTLPYRSATGSGVIPLAYYFDKPVVISDVPGLSDEILEGRTGWSCPAGDVEALAATLGCLTADTCAATVPEIRAHRSTLTWERLARATIGPMSAV